MGADRQWESMSEGTGRASGTRAHDVSERILMTTWLITSAGWLIFALWMLLLVPTVFMLFFRTLHRKTTPLPELPKYPRLSVIVPARNEGPKIEATLRSLLASEYPELEVIAVDDRSDDDTGEIMDRLANDDRRLSVIHVDSLPDGWLGKNHALQLGTSRASGEYLLLTDGDILFTPDALQRAVRYAVHGRIDHLCLIPRMIPGGYWENALTAYFGLIFSVGTFAWLVPTPLKWAYAGVGAFNLVHTEAYKSVGGHEPIRLDVLDDVKLGKLMKRSGFRQDILVAGSFVRVKWQGTAGGVIGGLEKNAFAAVDYSPVKLTVVTATLLTMLYLPYVAPLFVPDVRCLGYLATVALVHWTYAVFGQRFGVGWLVCPALPAVGLLLLWAFWRSAWVTLRQGGVRWRDTFYPLGELRRRLYR